MKHFYLVRHGETADNHRWIHQSIGVPLNERGKREAEHVATILRTLSIDNLLASDTERAKETAAPIAAMLSQKIQLETELRELHRGVLIEGSHHLSWRSIKGALLLFFCATNHTWHFSNGENVYEFRSRLERVLALLAETHGEHIIVVTHRGVINGLRFGIRYGFHTALHLFALGAVLGRTANGSITELTYDAARTTPWQVERSNDTRHLRGL